MMLNSSLPILVRMIPVALATCVALLVTADAMAQRAGVLRFPPIGEAAEIITAETSEPVQAFIHGDVLITRAESLSTQSGLVESLPWPVSTDPGHDGASLVRLHLPGALDQQELGLRDQDLSGVTRALNDWVIATEHPDGDILLRVENYNPRPFVFLLRATGGRPEIVPEEIEAGSFGPNYQPLCQAGFLRHPGRYRNEGHPLLGDLQRDFEPRQIALLDDAQGVLCIENLPDLQYRRPCLISDDEIDRASGRAVTRRENLVTCARLAASRASLCASTLGWSPPEEAHVRLLIIGSEGCPPGVQRHEVGHLLGLFHEHQRVDRDRYLRVTSALPLDLADQYEPIFAGYRARGESNLDPVQRPYDYGSIMHYPAETGIESLPVGIPIGGDSITTGDVVSFDLLYGYTRPLTIGAHPPPLSICVGSRRGDCAASRGAEASASSPLPAELANGQELWLDWNMPQGSSAIEITAFPDSPRETEAFQRLLDNPGLGPAPVLSRIVPGRITLPRQGNLLGRSARVFNYDRDFDRWVGFAAIVQHRILVTDRGNTCAGGARIAPWEGFSDGWATERDLVRFEAPGSPLSSWEIVGDGESPFPGSYLFAEPVPRNLLNPSPWAVQRPLWLDANCSVARPSASLQIRASVEIGSEEDGSLRREPAPSFPVRLGAPVRATPDFEWLWAPRWLSDDGSGEILARDVRIEYPVVLNDVPETSSLTGLASRVLRWTRFEVDDGSVDEEGLPTGLEEVENPIRETRARNGQILRPVEIVIGRDMPAETDRPVRVEAIYEAWCRLSLAAGALIRGAPLLALPTEDNNRFDVPSLGRFVFSPPPPPPSEDSAEGDSSFVEYPCGAEYSVRFEPRSDIVFEHWRGTHPTNSPVWESGGAEYGQRLVAIVSLREETLRDTRAASAFERKIERRPFTVFPPGFSIAEPYEGSVEAITFGSSENNRFGWETGRPGFGGGIQQGSSGSAQREIFFRSQSRFPTDMRCVALSAAQEGADPGFRLGLPGSESIAGSATDFSFTLEPLESLALALRFGADARTGFLRCHEAGLGLVREPVEIPVVMPPSARDRPLLPDAPRACGFWSC